MSSRFINCSACKGCHTGRGGQFCKFLNIPKSPSAGAASMAMSLPPDRDSPEYESYLAEKIEEEEIRLKSLQDRCRVTSMEEQLARLRLQTSELQADSQAAGGHSASGAQDEETSVAGRLLTASKRGSAGSAGVQAPASADCPPFIQRSKEERDALSKLKALSHLSELKPVEKVTYRDFISAMTKVLKFVIELGINPTNYVAHMNFITLKAALNVYATDALIRYEEGVTERVISGQYKDWSSADPECVALFLGADATYAIRQGGNRWSRQGSSNFGPARDFSDWPKEICWLYNNASCYFPRCKKAHICAKCKKTGHTLKECKISDDTTSPATPEVSSSKQAKEVRKP